MEQESLQQYDIIIAGAGAAGLSLAYYLSRSPLAPSLRVLLLDKDAKKQNDRTWGFWTKEATPYDSLVSQSFPKAEFISSHFQKVLSLAPYQYKVLQGKHFYDFMLKELAQLPNFYFRQEEIKSLEPGDEKATVHTNIASYRANWIFNSCFLGKELWQAAKESLYLQQHFKGWVVQLPRPVFSTDTVRLFDFRTPQQGQMRFVYLIPQTADRALVEFTLFSKRLLEPADYTTALRQYMEGVLKEPQYEIVEEEWGVIPMTTYSFPRGSGRIVPIGSLAGASKPSTGYTFLRIQQHCQQLVKLLEQEKPPYGGVDGPKRFRLYDAALLNIMEQRGGESERIFSELFRNNPPARILRFLDEETNLAEELRIMHSVPRGLFIQSLLNLGLGLPLKGYRHGKQ
jgi:lycopene beta-cyclase